MPLLKYSNAKISAISCCVPKNELDNLQLEEYGTIEERKKYIETTNVRFRRVADDNTTASDLCYHAADKLLIDVGINRDSIDALILVTQTPDYFLPPSSIILQNRLKLSTSIIAFDVNLGCSGYVNGLNIAYSFLQNENINRVLFLCGDTLNKLTSLKDKTSGYLFGDAGSATLIDKCQNSDSYFSLNSDGSESNILLAEHGAFRNFNQWKRPELKMDGMGVFNFTISKIPKDVKKLLCFANSSVDEIDSVVYHQANKFINDFISKKIKVNSEKTPFSMYEFGNTSSASIPLTIINTYKDGVEYPKRTILSGFGVGLSWAHCLMDLENIKISEIVEI